MPPTVTCPEGPWTEPLPCRTPLGELPLILRPRLDALRPQKPLEPGPAGSRAAERRVRGCGGTARKGGRQGLWATYGHPARDTEGQRRRAASAAPASGEPRGGSWLTAGPGRARPERSAARRQKHGVGPGLYRALIQEALGAGGGGGRPGSPAALCVFSPPRRPLYAPGPTRGW